MAKDIILKNSDYTIEKDVDNKTKDETKDPKKDPFGNSMLFAGIGVLALLFLMLKKK